MEGTKVLLKQAFLPLSILIRWPERPPRKLELLVERLLPGSCVIMSAALRVRMEVMQSDR